MTEGMQDKVLRFESDFKVEFTIINLLLGYDSHINDIADNERGLTPLMMVLLNKEMFRHPNQEDHVANLVEGLLQAGAVFEATEQQREKIKKYIQGKS